MYVTSVLSYIDKKRLLTVELSTLRVAKNFEDHLVRLLELLVR